MDQVNGSVVNEFVLLGLAQSLGMQLLLFLFFSLFYVGIIVGNLFIVFTVIFDSHLHSPMYILLANLSLVDLGLSSTTVPRMISDLFSDCKIISFHSCMIQMFFIHVMGGVEMILLIAMAYDRYTAICKPLHYLTIMNLKMCVLFAVAAWVIGVMHAVSQFVFVINLPFCGPNNVGSFYCDFPRVIKLACMDTYRLEFVVTANSGFISMGTFFFLIVSYIFILITVRQQTSKALSKAFITLSAHITVVVLFFTPCM
ncbi:olfactory receptor 4F21-like, partial [Suricata suricatta]|uniref:olfactory receptor 4F21-like n=1 Tax=Suricata suricatta TaxID=37032 RepID=UPI0011559E96